MDPKLKKLIFKTAIFTLSMSIAWWLIKSGHLNALIEVILPLKFISAIVAGLFYTSFLTSPISVAMLVVLAKDNNPASIALLAGIGGVLGDLIIVKFFRQELSSDLALVSHQMHLQKITRLLQKFRLEFIIPLLGAMIIASPFPDELGLMMLGASKLKYREIVLLTYILNTAGILLIVVPVNLLT